jgi:tetratricopeptide (TPR) repeat protein
VKTPIENLCRTSNRGRVAVAATAIFVACSALVVHGAPSADDLRAEVIRGLDEFDEAQRVQQEQPDRARQLFRSAAQRMQSVAGAGVENGRLQYNIGNAHLQSGDIGQAILHYRRAERLIPNDPLLKDNLSLARSKRLTSIAATSESELLRTAFFWHYQASTAQRTIGALVLYVAFWLLLMAWNRWPRRSVIVMAVVSIVITAALAASISVSNWQDRNQPGGVVLAADVAVYKGPGPSYQRLFEQPLQPGVEFILLEKRGEWWNIELADGKTGWVSASAAELIPGSAVKTLEVSTS